MLIDVNSLRKVGAEIRDNEDGSFYLTDTQRDTWQLAEVRNADFVGRDVLIRVRIEFPAGSDKNFCLHHFGDRDALIVTPEGRVARIDLDVIRKIDFVQIRDRVFLLEVVFHSAAPGFSLGLAAERSRYAGDGSGGVVLSELTAAVRETPLVAQLLTRGRQQAAAMSAEETNARPSGRRIRFVIPVHQDKAIWLNQFLLSLDRAALRSGAGVCEVYLLLTSQADMAYFRVTCTALQLSFDLHFLPLRELLTGIDESGRIIDFMDTGALRAMAVFKKLAGLYLLALQDDEDVLSLCIDGDTICLKWDEAFAARVEENYSDQRFFGVEVADLSIFNVTNRTAMGLLDKDAERSEERYSSLYRVYTWFFEAPIYGSKDFLGFVKAASDSHGGVADFFRAITYRSFEHTAFAYHLVSQGYRIVDYMPTSNRIPEHLTAQALANICERFGYRPLWLTARAYAEGVPVAEEKIDPYLLCHADR